MIRVLRLGHRVFRDQRISSHVFLVARALGAREGMYSGQRDINLEGSIKRVTGQWGGPFSIRYVKGWKRIIRNFKGMKVHLTVYGLPFQKNISRIRRAKNLLVIVGGEKVPSEVYKLSDLNLSVGSQPHSEVSALGIFLYELSGRRFREKFQNAKRRIIPQDRGKRVIRL